MNRVRITAVCGLVAAAVALIVAAPALAASSTSHAVYSFDLTSPNIATSPSGGGMASPGDSIKVTGSGTFNPVAQTVQASGRFVHYNANGTVHCQGTWKATAFTSFADFGTNSDGQEGAVLSLVVTHYCSTMGMTMSGIPMTVTSIVTAPAGYVAGTTMGPFTVPTAGSVVMQPQQ